LLRHVFTLGKSSSQIPPCTFCHHLQHVSMINNNLHQQVINPGQIWDNDIINNPTFFPQKSSISIHGKASAFFPQKPSIPITKASTSSCGWRMNIELFMILGDIKPRQSVRLWSRHRWSLTKIQTLHGAHELGEHILVAHNTMAVARQGRRRGRWRGW